MFRIKTLLGEPLLHFCLLGAGFFWLAGSMSGANDEIVVNQSLKKALGSDYERKHGMKPTDTQLRGLVATWIDDELLYREALRLGLDESDPVMRRRLIQSMRFLAEDEAGGLSATEKDLETVLSQNAEQLTIQPTVSFQHVFFPKGNDNSRLVPEALVKLKKGQDVSVGNAFIHGKKFEGLTRSRINTLFGESFSSSVFGSKTGEWLGPIQSSFGEHLVLVHEYQEARLPKLKEVANQVQGLWRQEQRDRALAKRLERLREEYSVVDESAAP